MDTSSLEDPWKSQLATGPKHPHPYLYQSGHLPPGGIKPHRGQEGIWRTWLDFQNVRQASYTCLLRPFYMFDLLYYGGILLHYFHFPELINILN